MKSEYEVVVAGAGPSGALNAALLALEGHDVLLLDKSGVFLCFKSFSCAILLCSILLQNAFKIDDGR